MSFHQSICKTNTTYLFVGFRHAKPRNPSPSSASRVARIEFLTTNPLTTRAVTLCRHLRKMLFFHCQLMALSLIDPLTFSSLGDHNLFFIYLFISYKARVRFGTWVRVRDSAIFEKIKNIFYIFLLLKYS